MPDVIVVGARCAGAATAMLLARRGYQVLLLDRDAPEACYPASTHMIWQAGVASLAAWGLLDQIKASNCPGMTHINLDVGAFVLSGEAEPFGEVSECYAPRRHVLDAILVRAAATAGAEVRRGSVTDLIRAEDRVVGVRYSDGARHTSEVYARLIIGADGTNSTVARLCGAKTYNETAQTEGSIFAYFDDLKLGGMEFYARPSRMFFAWDTNAGQTLLGLNVPYADFRKLSRDPEAGFFSEAEALCPAWAARVRAARRVDEWKGFATRSFFRDATGPGWALVGDAGLTMDPITAAGITNAFRDAELLASCLDDGFSQAGDPEPHLSRFGALRDAAAMPLFMFTNEMAKLAPASQEFMDLLSAMQHQPSELRKYLGIFAQSVSPETFFDAANVQKIMHRHSVLENA